MATIINIVLILLTIVLVVCLCYLACLLLQNVSFTAAVISARTLFPEDYEKFLAVKNGPVRVIDDFEYYSHLEDVDPNVFYVLEEGNYVLKDNEVYLCSYFKQFIKYLKKHG